MNNPTAKRLEEYTIRYPQEVLIVTAEIDGEEDQIAIFKGYSSSLMRPTAFDPDVPVLSEKAKIICIDRVANPYNPEIPIYIQKELSWEVFQLLLSKVGI